MATSRNQRQRIRVAVTAVMGMALAVGMGAAQPAVSSTPLPACNPVDTPTQCARKLYALVGVVFLSDHDMTKAVDGFRQIVRIDAEFAPAWFNLGVLAEHRKDWPEAKTNFDRYLAVAPHGPDAERARQELTTLIPYLAGNVTPAQEATVAYDTAIQRARLLLDKRFYKEAIAEAGHAESLNVSRWEAYAVISLVMTRQQRPADARRFAEMAIGRAPLEQRSALRKTLQPAP